MILFNLNRFSPPIIANSPNKDIIWKKFCNFALLIGGSIVATIRLDKMSGAPERLSGLFFVYTFLK